MFVFDWPVIPVPGSVPVGKKVLVVGAGGLGSPLLLYLAAAGVGTLGVIDDDVVDFSNLQRQVVHDTSKVGVDNNRWPRPWMSLEAQTYYSGSTSGYFPPDPEPP